MALVYWPSDLPQHVSQAGFQATYADGVLRTKTDAGPGKARRRYSSAARPLVCSMLLSRTLLARLDRFWEEEIKHGAMAFIMFDPIYDGSPLAGLATEAGRQLLVTRKNLVMFPEPAVVVCAGPVFRATFTLSVMP